VVVGAAEDLERGVSLYTEALAQLLLLGAVNLCEGNVLVLELSSGLLVLGSEGLAVATPWCEDWWKSALSLAAAVIGSCRLTLCEDEIVLLDETIKGVLGEVVDVAGSSKGCQGSETESVLHCG